MTKEQITGIAKTLNSAGFSIHNYDAEKAKMILSDANVSQQTISLFDENAFDVFMELMRIQVKL
jgi:hypothetical protein